MLRHVEDALVVLINALILLLVIAVKLYIHFTVGLRVIVLFVFFIVKKRLIK